MRGHKRCRSHRAAPRRRRGRDAELGPRGAGAPPGNLNALKHGRYSHPLLLSDLDRMAVAIVQQPDDLALQIGQAILSIQDRISDPFLALVAVRSLLPRLIDRVADLLLTAELEVALQPLSPAVRDLCIQKIKHLAAHESSQARLLAIRKIKKRVQNNHRNRDR